MSTKDITLVSTYIIVYNILVHWWDVRWKLFESTIANWLSNCVHYTTSMLAVILLVFTYKNNQHVISKASPYHHARLICWSATNLQSFLDNTSNHLCCLQSYILYLNGGYLNKDLTNNPSNIIEISAQIIMSAAFGHSSWLVTIIRQMTVQCMEK